MPGPGPQQDFFVQCYPTQHGIGPKRPFGSHYNVGIGNHVQRHPRLGAKRRTHITRTGNFTAKGSEKVSVDINNLKAKAPLSAKYRIQNCVFTVLRSCKSPLVRRRNPIHTAKLRRFKLLYLFSVT